MVKADGHFAILSIFDRFFYEVGFRDGVQVTHMTRRKRETDPFAVTSTGNQCTAWYLVTTSYYPDGTAETDWEYLYTSCSGCQPNELCDELGGEGAGGLSTSVIAQESWVVEAAGSWKVISTESFTGIKNEKEERGGHFTGMTHNSSAMQAAGVTGAKMKWDETGVITNAEGYKAVCLISGWVICESRPEESWAYFVPGRDKTFFFNNLNWH
ncbi:MAG: hypothetical protein ABW019_10615 [Chitinophagaceae bacterium]